MPPSDDPNAPDDSRKAEGQESPIIHLQRRRLARELAGELDGLFGIELPDIEEAIGRLYQDFESGNYDERERLGRMPAALRQVMSALDRVQELAAVIHQQELADRADDATNADGTDATIPEDPLAPTLQHVIDLMENQLQRLRRMQAEAEGSSEI